MTFQPQPGRPDPYNSQGTPGQYRNQPLNGPYSEDPQAGRFGQNPYGQQQYGGRASYPGGRPPKSKKGAIIAIVAAVLVLCGGGVTAWLLTTDDGRSNSAAPATPRASAPIDGPTSTTDPGGEEAVSAVAQAYADAVNNQDEAAATDLMCAKVDPGVLYQTVAGQLRLGTGRVSTSSDTFAMVEYPAQDAEGALTWLFVEFRDGAWCVTD